MPDIPLWSLVLGVIVLGAVLAYGISRNRQRSAGEKRLSQAATRKLYEEEDRST